jgi:hypothetical protein
MAALLSSFAGTSNVRGADVSGSSGEAEGRLCVVEEGQQRIRNRLLAVAAERYGGGEGNLWLLVVG